MFILTATHIILAASTSERTSCFRIINHTIIAQLLSPAMTQMIPSFVPGVQPPEIISAGRSIFQEVSL